MVDHLHRAARPGIKLMSEPNLNWITNFICGIADDVLRDLYVRGKYRDVILPMTVLRRLDAVLEPTKKAVIDMKASLDAKKIVHLHVLQITFHDIATFIVEMRSPCWK